MVGELRSHPARLLSPGGGGQSLRSEYSTEPGSGTSLLTLGPGLPGWGGGQGTGREGQGAGREGQGAGADDQGMGRDGQGAGGPPY